MECSAREVASLSPSLQREEGETGEDDLSRSDKEGEGAVKGEEEELEEGEECLEGEYNGTLRYYSIRINSSSFNLTTFFF